MGVPHGTSDRTTLGEWALPARCMVVPLQWAMNRDEGRWREDAGEFRPERFIKEGKEGEVKVEEPTHFLPFQVMAQVFPLLESSHRIAQNLI